jgi:hypothetical protein
MTFFLVFQHDAFAPQITLPTRGLVRLYARFSEAIARLYARFSEAILRLYARFSEAILRLYSRRRPPCQHELKA